MEQWGISWTTSENETSLVTPHFSRNTCIHLVSSQRRLLSEASVELIIWLSVCRLFVLYGQTTTDDQFCTPTLDTDNLCVFSLETYLGNICEHVSSAFQFFHFFRLQLWLWKRWPSDFILVRAFELNRSDAWTKLCVISVIYYNSSWLLGTTWIKALET